MFLSKKRYSQQYRHVEQKLFCRGLRLVVFSILRAKILWNNLQNIEYIVIRRYWHGSVLCLVLRNKVVRPNLNAESEVGDMI